MTRVWFSTTRLAVLLTIVAGLCLTAFAGAQPLPDNPDPLPPAARPDPAPTPRAPSRPATPSRPSTPSTPTPSNTTPVTPVAPTLSPEEIARRRQEQLRRERQARIARERAARDRRARAVNARLIALQQQAEVQRLREARRRQAEAIAQKREEDAAILAAGGAQAPTTDLSTDDGGGFPVILALVAVLALGVGALAAAAPLLLRSDLVAEFAPRQVDAVIEVMAGRRTEIVSGVVALGSGVVLLLFLTGG